MPDALHLPLDEVSTTALGERGLRMALVDADDDAFEPWFGAVARGFLDLEPLPANRELVRDDYRRRRATGVWDDRLADPATPVGTVAAWPLELTLPGGALPTWAISSVSVAPTHRRLGVATALLTAELRTAVAGGFPLASLTVSEATIYGRWGFGPAAWAADLAIDAHGIAWTGPSPSGRVQFVTRDTMLRDATAVLDRVRAGNPGATDAPGILTTRLFGRETVAEELRSRRILRYDAEDGSVDGFAVYTVQGDDHEFANSRVDVLHLAAATDDAYAALWRTILGMDLVGEVTALLRPVDEPLRWMVSDPRRVRTSAVTDHHWLRVLDPVAVLGARTYAGPATIGLLIEDDLGFAAGTFLLEIGADGSAHAAAVEAVPEEAAFLRMPVASLGSILLGGVTASALVAAGRGIELRAGSAAAVDLAFGTSRAPWLHIWY